ncbi:MAG TPA: hypothetical protein VN224_06200 [Xanthomonadales bacterium]|nr:hypothetical protein [Xanthomonadales bacterium]
MRSFVLAAAPVLACLVLAAGAPASPAGYPLPSPSVLVVADVGETAQRTMPGPLWRKLVADYLGAHSVSVEDGTALPDEARCRSAHAAYAVFATFDRAMRLPGFAQDTDRAYGIARFTVRNCVTGVVAPTKTVRVESEPLTESARGEGDAAVAAAMWQRAVQVSLAHDPLVLAPPPARPARITNIVDGIAYLDHGDGFSVNQVLRDYADRNAHPHAPIQLVVVEINRRYVSTSVVGNGTPHVGDYVDAAPVK